MEYGRLTVPEVGVFERKRNSAYELKRLDLVGGGFRLGLNGDALFPLTDAQGNVRGYISRSGWKGMHAYYPFGSTVDFVNQQGEDKRRWQGKEFDGEHGKLYFGARYYDPFLGLWMSPDPAGQFMNPYSYGGDPLNYIDPTGLWSLGIGFVFGWDSERGWHMGFGFAADLTNGKGDGIGFNLSYTWHDDGSSSFNIGSTAHFWIDFIDINLGLSYSYNTYSGSVLSANGGICFGEKEVACAGVEAGGSLYWDKNGDFMGGAAYAGVYAEVAGGFSRVSGGYDLGLFGIEGRGLYAGGNLGGLYAEVSQHYDFGWGVSGHLDVWNYDSQKGFDYFLKDFIDEIFNGDEYESAKEDKTAVGKNLFGAIWCGSGPGGKGSVVTGGVDAGCRLHDFRYDAESKRTGEDVAGIRGALTNINQRIVAADVKLVANSFGNMLIGREPVAGFGVGVAFSVISAWKIPLMMFADLLPRFHFDDTYLRRNSWENSLR